VSSGSSAARPADRAFGLLQRVLPKHLLSRGMHRLARSTNPRIRDLLVGSTLRAYPMIDMREALEPDPYTYPSFNAFFTRALRPDARTIAPGDELVACPVDGTISQFGPIRDGQMLQAKGKSYSVSALLADESGDPRYAGGSFACIYLAPYNYHRIHMPLDGKLIRTSYVPGALFSVNAATANVIPGLYARNERVICEFDTPLGHLAMVLVGALFVGSIETVYAGEINPPPLRGSGARTLMEGIGLELRKGQELARFNMGSTVILLMARPGLNFADLGPGTAVRLGQPLARTD
jgi:phosphatidylserine decarboxylase